MTDHLRSRRRPVPRPRPEAPYPELAPIQGFPTPSEAPERFAHRTDSLQSRMGDWFWHG